MRKHSFYRALALAALLATTLTQTAFASAPQQAMAPATVQSAGLTGPYDAPAPTVGD